MGRKCDNCKNIATVHLTEIKNGKKLEKHLCEQCAAQQEGFPIKPHTPINELLTNFVLAHQSGTKELTAGQVCDHCSMAWAEFKQGGLLGCEHDYVQFEKELTPLLARAHEGATHHLGKVPVRRGGSGVPMKRQADLARLRKELQRAVENEDYERAAKLRDQIRAAEK
ncbi:MAG: UvrB/UvrC motif-containing protein [Phycisphaerae bacterium]|nr:UvrB/UvrC motif-containing protein [Phycisphaerae bacterium]